MNKYYSILINLIINFPIYLILYKTIENKYIYNE